MLIYQLTKDGRLLNVVRDCDDEDFKDMEIGEKRACHEGTFDDGSYWERIE